jgi:hypothetical protein
MFWILTLQVRFERKESMSCMKLGFIGIFTYEFLYQPVVPDLVEGPLYVQKDGKSVLL